MIYVVDDEPMLLELASVILEPLGYQVSTFCVPEKALQAFRTAKCPPALLITDYAMQSMNGVELIACCRQLRPDQKVLLVSGTVGPEIYRDVPAKPDRFLAKPFQSRQLAEAVAAMLTA